MADPIELDDQVEQVKPWERARRFGGPFISQRHRRCHVCARQFLNGALMVEFGYTTHAFCDQCLEESRAGRLDLENYL